MIGSRQGIPVQRGGHGEARVVRGKLFWLRREPRAVMVCAECDLSGGPFGLLEAKYLAALHDQLQHGGNTPAATR